MKPKIFRFPKLALGILAFSLLIPMSPIISPAQAKLCCKKLCLKHVKKSPFKRHGSHANSPLSQNESRDCCKKNCIKATLLIPSFTFISLPAWETTVNPIKTFPEVSQTVSTLLNRAPPRSFQNLRYRISLSLRTSPLFLTNSSFLL